MWRLVLLLSAVLLFSITNSQDISYVKFVTDTLASPAMFGRGYVNNGDKLAATFIRNEFNRFGLNNFRNDFFQSFKIPINTFPDTVSLSIDGKMLSPGRDFVLFSFSPSVNQSFELIWSLKDSLGLYSIIPEVDFSEKVLVTEKNQKVFLKEVQSKSYLNKLSGIVFLQENKPWWHVSNGNIVKDFFAVQVVKEKISENSKVITVKSNNLFYEDYLTQNVVGYIKGKLFPDSFFVFSAHYDHLGMMGSGAYFPGANDNASGTAVILDLAKHYSKKENCPDYSIAFIAFSAEEAGLLGSDYYASNPLFPLDQIKFLINLDMVGSGSQGIKVVNGSVFKNEFEKLKQLNEKNELLFTVAERGEAANSDHYPFYAKGVPCFFIYTLGEECKEYHNIYDIPQNTPFTEYNDLFRLMNMFIIGQ